MDLNDLLVRYPGVSLASRSENERILEFFDQAELDGGTFVLRYERSPDFFKLKDFRAPSGFVLCGKSEAGRVSGLLSVSIRDGYLDGSPIKVGYIADFRVSFHRTLMKSWRQLSGAIMDPANAVDQIDGARYFVMASVDGNSRALRSFFERENPFFAMDKLSSYQMINVLGEVFPGAFRICAGAQRGVRVEVAGQDSREELLAFLDTQNQKKTLGFKFTPNELDRRLVAWDGLELSHFLIARSTAPPGRIVGCVCPWSPATAKRMRVGSLPSVLELARKARVFRPWVNFPAPGDVLKVLYLTHLELDGGAPLVEQRQVFTALFQGVLSRYPSGDRHMLAFADFPQRSLASSLKGLLLQKIPMQLHVVRHHNVPSLSADPRRDGMIPGFEMAMV